MKHFSALAVITLLAVCACAQNVPPPPQGLPPAQTDGPTFAFGDGTMRGSRLSPYDNAFAVTFTSKDGKIIEGGIWSDQLRLIEVDGKKVFVRTQSVANPISGKGKWSINRFDPETLAPISSESHERDGSVEKRIFHGTHVEVRTTAAEPGAKEEVRELDLPKLTYDFGNCCMASLFSATLPLRLGYKAIAPTAVIAKNDDPTVPYRVVGREKVRAGYLGMVNAYVVEFPNPACCYIRFWIIDKPPYMVRMTLTPTPDKPYSQSFDMIGSK